MKTDTALFLFPTLFLGICFFHCFFIVIIVRKNDLDVFQKSSKRFLNLVSIIFCYSLRMPFFYTLFFSAAGIIYEKNFFYFRIRIRFFIFGRY